MRPKHTSAEKMVSIIVPCHNHEKTIVKDIQNICKVMDQTRWKYELILIDDGSSDKTFKHAKKIKRKNVVVYRYEKNRGKGYAVKFGMKKARGYYISFIDAGMDINPNGISMLLEHMEWYQADIVVGSKRHPVSKVEYPLIRRLYSFFYYSLIKVLFRVKVTDTQTGAKLYTRKVVKRVLPRLVVDKFAFDIEILAVARYLGFKRIYEAPVEVKLDPKKSHFSAGVIFDTSIRAMIYDTFAIFFRMYVQRFYDASSKHLWRTGK